MIVPEIFRLLPKRGFCKIKLKKKKKAGSFKESNSFHTLTLSQNKHKKCTILLPGINEIFSKSIALHALHSFIRILFSL